MLVQNIQRLEIEACISSTTAVPIQTIQEYGALTVASMFTNRQKSRPKSLMKGTTRDSNSEEHAKLSNRLVGRLIGYCSPVSRSWGA